jgi:hypothetical protein
LLKPLKKKEPTMKTITTLAAFLVAFVGAAIATDSDEQVLTLPTQMMHYGVFPTAVEQPVPVLPDSIAGAAGYVLIQFDIASNGRLSNITVLEASDEQLAKFARVMVRSWVYSNTGPTVTATQPIVFEAGSQNPILLALR